MTYIRVFRTRNEAINFVYRRGTLRYIDVSEKRKYCLYGILKLLLAKKYNVNEHIKLDVSSITQKDLDEANKKLLEILPKTDSIFYKERRLTISGNKVLRMEKKFTQCNCEIKSKPTILDINSCTCSQKTFITVVGRIVKL